MKSTIDKWSILGFTVVLSLFFVYPHEGYCQRAELDLNNDWFFKKKTDRQWQSINLPHTYNADDPFDDEPGYYRGQASYRKIIRTDDLNPDQKHFLQFDAVNQEAAVFVNGVEAGIHLGGYTAFNIPISSLLSYRVDTIDVLVNNRHNPNIPPLKGDFNFYGGIYRSVKLLSVDSVHFSMEQYGSDGIFIYPLEVTDSLAHIRVRGDLDGAHFNGNLVEIQVFDETEKEVASTKSKILHENGNWELELQIERPDLWTLTSPVLYRFDCSVQDEKSGKILDELSIYYGFRNIKFDPKNGFYLNSQPVKLLGVNRHQDLPGKGNALSHADHLRDMQIIKEMGCNFLRTAHYPQDRFITDYCDRNGILVSMEIPLDHQITMSDSFTEVCMNMTREMVYQYFNHPSVIIWAYMNEMGLGKQIERDREEMESVAKLARKLDTEIRELDPYRWTMIPNHGDFDIYHHFGLTNIPMIVGWNLYYGWYEPDFNGFGAFVDHAHLHVPDKPIIITEYGAGADPRISSPNPERFDFSLEWSMDFHDAHLRQIKERPFIAGSAVWNMFDFGSERRQDAVPHVNNKGLCGFDRQPKPIFYLYKSHLRADDDEIPKSSFNEVSSKYWNSNDLLKINFGTDFYFQEDNGQTWYPVEAIASTLLEVDGGDHYRPRNRGIGTDRAIDRSDNDPVYQTQMVGASRISFHVPEGLYHVVLHMSDIYRDQPVDQSVFVNKKRIDCFDLHPFTAYRFSKEIRAENGKIELKFESPGEMPVVNGIELIRVF